MTTASFQSRFATSNCTPNRTTHHASQRALLTTKPFLILVLNLNMFSSFPKTRPPLPPAYEKIYAEHYISNRKGGSSASGLSRRMESWMHRKVAGDVAAAELPKATLELGAGTLNHLDYEPHSTPYDVVEPFSELLAEASQRERVRTVFSDVTEIPMHTKYDRIISVAVLEHICDLPRVVARSGLLLDKGGQFRAGIPSEGAILWYLGWKFTTGIEFKLKYGLDYSVLMRNEHVNKASEIEDVLRYFFSEVKNDALGYGKHVSFYQFYACSKPYTDRCQSYV